MRGLLGNPRGCSNLLEIMLNGRDWMSGRIDLPRLSCRPSLSLSLCVAGPLTTLSLSHLRFSSIFSLLTPPLPALPSPGTAEMIRPLSRCEGTWESVFYGPQLLTATPAPTRPRTLHLCYPSWAFPPMEYHSTKPLASPA